MLFGSLFLFLFVTLQAQKTGNRPSGVMLYEENEFQGRVRYLPIGAWSLKSMEETPNQFSFNSAKILPGTLVTFYQFKNFTGIQTVPTASDIPNFQLAKISELTGSIIVEYAIGVTIFEDENYKGDFHFLPPGEYMQLQQFKISSFVVPPLTKAEFFEHPNFEGEQFVSYQNLKQLSPTWNDKISSIKVSKLLSILLYEEPLYQGSAQYFRIGKHSQSEISLHNKLGSVKVSKGLKVTFFLNEDFEGLAVQLDHDWNNFTSISLNSIKSLLVEAICNPPCLQGSCKEPNVCGCDPGWEGPQCNIPTCSPPCKNGVCRNTGKGGRCECYSGWRGHDCREAHCSFLCKQGNCHQPELCECFSGWTGKACDKLISICGDGICDSRDESCGICPEDCGNCPIARPRQETKVVVRAESTPLSRRSVILLGIFVLILILLFASTMILKCLAIRVENSAAVKKSRGKLD